MLIKSKHLLITGLLVFLIILLYPLPFSGPAIKINPDPSLKPARPAGLELTSSNLSQEVQWQEVSLDLNINANHRQSSEHLTALTETLGAGVCVFDANQDGWMDVFFVGGSGHNRSYGRDAFWNKELGNRLFLNQDGKNFVDVTELYGLNKNISGMGCTVADLDQDGLVDIFVAGLGGVTFFKNIAGTAFKEVDLALKDENFWSTGVSLADFDHDGLLDIYITNYIHYKKGHRTFEQASGFDAVVDTDFNPALYDPQANRLFKNLGNLTFDDVTEAVGVSNKQGRSLASYWLDLNEDGWPDLMVINDASQNRIFINDKGTLFIEGDARYSPFELADSHGLAMGDINNDGKTEFLFSRQAGSPAALLALDESKTTATGQGSFKDIAWLNGLATIKNLPYAGWASVMADFNNDGFEDVFMANGRALPDSDSRFVAQAQSNTVFLNTGDDAFQMIKASKDKLAAYSSRGAATVDIDNDGYLELVVANNNDRLQVFQNVGNRTRHWIGFSLPASLAAQGLYASKIEGWTDQGYFKTQIRQTQAAFSQSDPRILLGLNYSKHIDKLKVHWKDGDTQTYKNIKPNQYYALDKSHNRLEALPNRTFQLKGNKPVDEMSASLRLPPEAIMDYLDIAFLANQEDKANNMPVELLLRAWLDADDEQKLALLNWIETHWQDDFLLLVKRALASDAQSLRLKALAILQKAELEISVAWLLPLLFDKDPAIQCRVAKAFQFFFSEEEALIHRKYLAVPTLSRLLESENNEEVLLCAIQALGAAEKKRALYPLIKLVNTSKSQKVQVAAITALGLIRDTLSLPLLRSIPQNIDTADKHVNADKGALIAASFIARARMDDPTLNKAMDDFFLPKDIQIRPALLQASLQAHTLTALYLHEGSVVFDQKTLNKYFNSIVASRSNPNKLPDVQQLALIKLIEARKNPQAANMLLVFFEGGQKATPNQDIVVAAFLALLKTGQPALLKQIEKQYFSKLSSFEVEQLTALIQSANDRHYIFSMAAQEYFLKQAAKNNDLMSALLDQWLLVSEKDLARLMAWALDLTEQNEKQNEILALCSKRTVPWSSTFARRPGHSNVLKNELNIAILNCALPHLPKTKTLSYNILSELLASADFSLDASLSLLESLGTKPYVTQDKKTVSLEQRRLVRDLYADKSLPLNRRLALLVFMAQRDHILAHTLLLAVLDEVSEVNNELLAQAIDALSVHGAHALVDKKLNLIMKTPTHPDDIRLKAARHLAVSNPQPTYDYISHYFNQAAFP